MLDLIELLNEFHDGAEVVTFAWAVWTSPASAMNIKPMATDFFIGHSNRVLILALGFGTLDLQFRYAKVSFELG